MIATGSFWTAEFSPFTPLHGVTVLVCAALMITLSWWGGRLRRRSEQRERRFRIGWALFVGVTQVAAAIYWIMPPRFELGLSLPLHLCDLAGLLTPIALVWSVRLPRALVYFWGLGLSSWAFIAPVVAHGPARSEFWVFWLTHTQIVGSSIYLLWVLRYRPTWGDTWRSILALVGYAFAITLAVNAPLGANYGYIGPSQPDRTAPLDVLGPWPWRMAPILAGEAMLMTALWLPWRLTRGSSRGRASNTPEPSRSGR